MDQLRSVLNDYVTVYFVMMVCICGFFLLNIVLAVIKAKFTEIQRENVQMRQKSKEMTEEKEAEPFETSMSKKCFTKKFVFTNFATF